MILADLTRREREIVRYALECVATGDVVPHDEVFHTLMGVEVGELRAVLDAWPRVDAIQGPTRLVIHNALEHLLGHPHVHQDAWDARFLVTKAELAHVFDKWRGQDGAGPARLGSIAPMFLIADWSRSLAYYRDALGFRVQLAIPKEDPFFGIVERDGVRIFVKVAEPGVVPRPNPTLHPWARWDAFIHVEAVDRLFRECTEAGARMRESLADTDEGLRGFAVEDSDGYVLFFGHPKRVSSVPNRGAPQAE